MYRVFSWTAVIVWMALIFYLSHQPAEESRELSAGVKGIFITFIDIIAPNIDLNFSTLHHVIRKNAHFFIYLILGFLVINSLRSSNVIGYRSVVLALLICIFYAIADEIHQLFIPGRSGEVRDVLIDTAGASVGIIVYLLFRMIMKNIKAR